MKLPGSRWVSRTSERIDSDWRRRRRRVTGKAITRESLAVFWRQLWSFFSLLIEDGSVVLVKFLTKILKSLRDEEAMIGVLLHLYEAFTWRHFDVLPHRGSHQWKQYSNGVVGVSLQERKVLLAIVGVSVMLQFVI